jgi:hypothetical protein
MKDWQIIQEMYHKLNSEHGDDLNQVDVVFRENSLLSDIRDYIKLPPEVTGWVYPAKSYVVGICYASWISTDFNEDFYDLLDDETLLFGNDQHFATYSENKEVYDKIIEEFGLPLPNTGVVPHIRKFYLKEFMRDFDA